LILHDRKYFVEPQKLQNIKIYVTTNLASRTIGTNQNCLDGQASTFVYIIDHSLGLYCLLLQYLAANTAHEGKDIHQFM